MPAKAKALPRLSRVQELLNYDATTGNFCWLQSGPGRSADLKAGWTCSTHGYCFVKIDGCIFPAHRLAWLFATGQDPADMEIDHINGDRSDNRFSNLRLADNRENQCNIGIARNNTSGVKGVYWHSRDQKWIAKVKKHGIHVHVGTFSDLETAAAAVQKARAELHGEFANHGAQELF